MSTQVSSPPPIPVTLDTEAIRRKLAGLSDPGRLAGSAGETSEIRETASRLCSILASLFGDDLDRLTLWSRIDSALSTAVAKVSDGDLDRLVSLCLDHVKADPAKAAACEPLGHLISIFGVRPPAWRMALLNYLGTHRYAVLVHGRARWEDVKARRIDL